MRVAMIAAAVAVAGTGGSAGAAPVRWTLSGVTFSDGRTANGSFVYDASVNLYSDPSITVDAFVSAGLPPYTYGSTSLIRNASATGVDFLATGTTRYLRLAFASALTDAGGAVALAEGGFETVGQNGDTRLIAGGSLTGSAVVVPEPASWAMMLAGFAAVGAAMRRRREAALAPVALLGG